MRHSFQILMATHRSSSMLGALLLVAGLILPGVVDASQVTFRYRPGPDAQSVNLAGEMNNWSATATAMSDADQDGLWEVVLELNPGKYAYKFVVNGTQWKTDESAAEFVDDGFGGKNSLVSVGDVDLVVGEAGGAVASSTPAVAETPTAAGGAAATQVTFRYQPVIGGVGSVSVAGSFNGWDAGANPLTDQDEDGVWEAATMLPRGKHQYKFVVNGTEWFTDDFAVEFVDDGFGGQNSQITVGAVPLVAGPGGNLEEASEPTAGLREVRFRHRPAGAPREIVVAGTFNDWTVGKSPLSDPDGDGEYSTIVLLPAGEYHYKFVVDGTWTTDREHADSFVDDGFGGENSVITVDDRYPAVKLEVGDGNVFGVGIEHGGSSTEVNNMGNGTVELTFRAHRNDIEALALHIVYPGKPAERRELSRYDSDAVYDYYRTMVQAGTGEAFRYVIEYADGGVSRYMTPGGLQEALPAESGWFTFTSAAFPPFETPEWVKDAVFYQIFPERFRNGDPANDPDFTEWFYEGKNTLPTSGKTNEEYYHGVKEWDDVAGLSKSPFRTDGLPDYFSFYGGDIPGVHQGLDYLEDLGITAIYFNPLFEAKSNHKYDCCDFLKIDPHFGTNDEFKAFVQDAHSRGIRIVLDIVFNHTGNCFWAFQDAVKKGPESETYEWYEFKKWPLPSGNFKAEDYYYCWWGFGDLPDLNFDLSRAAPSENGVWNRSEAEVNEPLMAHLMEVVDFWIGEMDCDGVRLDVANEVPFWFWKQFNARVKGIKPDAYIVGEIWGNASDWVRPGMFDATMNYAFFRDPVTRFLGQGQGTAAQFDRQLASGRFAYHTQATQVMMNLVGSHDTVRFLTQVGGNVNRVKLASMFAMTYVGAPHIYYGDEIAMEGGKDPDCRRPFRWDWQEDPSRAALHDHYRKLSRIRAEYAALRRGEFHTLQAQGTTYAYVRNLGDEAIVVLLNAGRSPATFALELAPFGKSSAVDLMTGEPVDLSGSHSLAPESGQVLKLN